MVELYKTILVPTDGSEPSNHALEHALVIAEKYDAKIQLLSVVSRIVMPFFLMAVSVEPLSVQLKIM